MATPEAAAFAARQGALFLEASAKTAVGVCEVFEDLVKRILDTPELWAPVTPESVGTSSGRGSGSTGGGGDGMPGTIDLGAAAGTGTGEEEYGGCGC